MRRDVMRVLAQARGSFDLAVGSEGGPLCVGGRSFLAPARERPSIKRVERTGPVRRVVCDDVDGHHIGI